MIEILLQTVSERWRVQDEKRHPAAFVNLRHAGAVRVALGAILAMGAPPGFAWAVQSDAATTAPSAPENGMDSGRLPEMPRVRLVRPSDSANDEAFVESVEGRVHEWLTASPSEGNAQQRMAALLASANVLLAERIEPLCSRRLLAIPEEDGFRPDPWIAAIDRVDQLLNEARGLLGSLSDRTDLPEGWLAPIQRHQETLAAFSSGLRAYLFSDETDQGRRMKQEAASALSPLLEHADPAVREAATLWQAHLRLALGDLERAASLLPKALSDPPADRLPYGFYVRLLDCRIAAQRGWSATALSLLMQVEERCDHWFSEQALRERASVTAQYERLLVLQDWYERLDSKTQERERTWCAAQMRSLLNESFREGSTEVMRLARAIPIVIGPPKIDSPSTQTPPEPSAPDGG